jgi:hypothetical protein
LLVWDPKQRRLALVDRAGQQALLDQAFGAPQLSADGDVISWGHRRLVVDCTLASDTTARAAAFVDAVAEDTAAPARQTPTTYSPPLPPAGRWEYKVLPIEELMGFATTKGTAARMQAALNVLAGEDWELVASTERDSRWITGETVILTLRRYVTTEEMFTARCRVEQRLRHEALGALAEGNEGA